MTMLEKMAEAIWPSIRAAGSFPVTEGLSFALAKEDECASVDRALGAARAALLAIREPSGAVKADLAFGAYTTTSYGGDTNTFDYVSEENVGEFAADLIDAILNETPPLAR